MTEATLHDLGVVSLFALAFATFVALRFVTAPYGRHMRAGWGPTVSNRAGWVLMEAPASLAFLAFYATGTHAGSAAPLALLALWQVHYAHRAFVYPLRTHTAGKRMPLLIAGLGASFNLFNAWLNARWIAALGDYPASWLVDPRFLLGAAVFAVGLFINLKADSMLIALRAGGDGYRIPRGWLFGWVCNPNYLGELVEWFGWAIATWSTAGLAFAVYSAANLVPRALDNLAWYRLNFPDYPPRRRAIVPWLL